MGSGLPRDVHDLCSHVRATAHVGGQNLLTSWTWFTFGDSSSSADCFEHLHPLRVEMVELLGVYNAAYICRWAKRYGCGAIFDTRHKMAASAKIWFFWKIPQHVFMRI